ncbi:MAG: ferrous iron transporter B [Clostridia bacterium]|nr:ferrous iron transporter B [Clostridia bacterium]
MTNIILVGNPNTGKTTLFNTITKKNNHVGNWHGITVDKSISSFKLGESEGTIVDLPGIYSLTAYTGEEKVATTYLEEHKSDVVVCLVDANTMKRSLLLAIELIKQNYSVVVAVNMSKEVSVNYAEIQRKLGVPVVPIDARKRSGAIAILQKVAEGKKPRENFDCVCSRGQIFNKIDEIMSSSGYREKIYGYSKLDKLLYNKYWALPIFMLVALFVFYLTFGHLGECLTSVVSNLFNYFSDYVNGILIKLNITPWAHSLVSNGIIGGIGVVVSFLPQVIILNLCLNFLEDMGYLSRVAICFDRPLKKIGLSGKSVMSILLGYGCTASAMLSTRTLESIDVKKRTALVLPFASCNAKLPIFLLVCSAFFNKFKVLIIFALYVFSIVLGLFVSFVAYKAINKTDSQFVMEIPPIRVQNPVKTIKNALSNTLDFIKRVGTTIVLCSVVVWLLSNVTITFKYATTVESSILYSVAHFVSPIFAPIGLNNWGAVVALIVGLSAKEMVVSSLAIINGVVGSLPALAASLAMPQSVVHFSPASALAFLVFVLLYSPCLSAISVMSKEIGKKFALFVFVYQIAIAYLASLVFYLIASNVVTAIIVLIVLALGGAVVIKYTRNKKCKTCKEKCYGSFDCR